MGNVPSLRRTRREYDPLELKMITPRELFGEDFAYPAGGLLFKHMGSGETWLEAIESLRKVCIENGVPPPERVYDTHWCCGTLSVIYPLSTKTRLNPEWARMRNGQFIAYTFYPERK